MITTEHNQGRLDPILRTAINMTLVKISGWNVKKKNNYSSSDPISKPKLRISRKLKFSRNAVNRDTSAMAARGILGEKGVYLIDTGKGR